jgi:hypothetical protein
LLAPCLFCLVPPFFFKKKKLATLSVGAHKLDAATDAASDAGRALLRTRPARDVDSVLAHDINIAAHARVLHPTRRNSTAAVAHWFVFFFF